MIALEYKNKELTKADMATMEMVKLKIVEQDNTYTYTRTSAKFYLTKRKSKEEVVKEIKILLKDIHNEDSIKHEEEHGKQYFKSGSLCVFPPIDYRGAITVDSDMFIEDGLYCYKCTILVS